MCQLLIDRGAGVNARTQGVNSSGKTPLMVAAAEGHADGVHLLLKRGAHRNLHHRSGWITHDRLGFRDTALHLAAERGSLEIVQLLCDAGADMNARAEWSMTALMYAGAQL